MRRGCVQTKTFRKGSEASSRAEGGRIRTSADYYFFAPTGGRYQTVFRGTLPRRCSIRRSRCGNSEAIVGVAVRANRLHLASKSAGQCEEFWIETRIYIDTIKQSIYAMAIFEKKDEYCRSTTPHENLGVRVRLGNKSRSRLYYPSVGLATERPKR